MCSTAPGRDHPRRGVGLLTLGGCSPPGNCSPPAAEAREGAQLGATLSLLDVNDDELPELFVGVKAAPTLDDAIVVYPGVDGGFGQGEASGTDVAGKAIVKPTSPLRIGR